MDIRIIAFGMIAVLAILFIIAKIFEKKSKIKNKQEALYAQIVFAFQENPSLQNYDTCVEEVMNLLDLNKTHAIKTLQNDDISCNN